MGKFSYGFWQKMMFAAEKRRQMSGVKSFYTEEFRTDAQSYWSDVTNVPLPDAKQKDVLSDFARKFVTKRVEKRISDFGTRAPEDIYPVF